MKFENTEVWGFQGALRGMRNPKESWNKSDSGYCGSNYCNQCHDNNICGEYYHGFGAGCKHEGEYIIGKNDMRLAQQLIRAGSEHRKFMRQIVVSVDITAPLYWWKEFDTYKIGTVANSTSTMHKLATTPISLECFETDDYEGMIVGEGFEDIVDSVDKIIEFCEDLRKRYLETNDIRYWKELIRWLPESWLQTRTVTMSYENLLAMCSKGQRRFHKLTEWSKLFIGWARTLPYAQELIFLDELEENNKEEIRDI